MEYAIVGIGVNVNIAAGDLAALASQATSLLIEAGHAIEAIYGAGGADHRFYVDTGPIIERGWAARAGLGFIGKNGMLISRRFGNWLFLAAVLTTAEMEPDPSLKMPASDGGAAANWECNFIAEFIHSSKRMDPNLMTSAASATWQTSARLWKSKRAWKG